MSYDWWADWPRWWYVTIAWSCWSGSPWCRWGERPCPLGRKWLWKRVPVSLSWRSGRCRWGALCNSDTFGPCPDRKSELSFLYLNITTIQIRDVQIKVKPNALHTSHFSNFLKPFGLRRQLPQDVVVHKDLKTEYFASLQARLMHWVTDSDWAAFWLGATASMLLLLKWRSIVLRHQVAWQITVIRALPSNNVPVGFVHQFNLNYSYLLF